MPSGVKWQRAKNRS